MLNPCCDLPTCEQPDIEPDVTPEERAIEEFRDLFRSFGMTPDSMFNDQKAKDCGVEYWTAPCNSENKYLPRIHGHLGGLHKVDDGYFGQADVRVHGIGVHAFIKDEAALPLFERAVRSLLETP